LLKLLWRNPFTCKDPHQFSEKNEQDRKTDPAVTVRDRLILTERFIAIALTLLVVFLHAVFLVNAGGLWRDEANSISLAMMPKFADIWFALKFDTHPVLHILIVKLWAAVFGLSDTSLRTLGFTVGVSVIAAFWVKAGYLGSRAPVIPLLLIGMNPLMIRLLDSARPYGIAVIASIIAFIVVWRAVQKPTYVRVIIASVMLVLCMQVIYQSAVFVLAIGIAAISVSIIRGGIKQALIIAVPFFIAAISLLPYAGHLQEARNWWPLARNPSDSNVAIQTLLDAINSPISWFMWLWIAVVILAITGMIQRLIQNRFTVNREESQEYFLIYCGITFLASIVCFLLFILYMVGPISLQVWHYAPLLVMIVVSAEPLIEQVTFRKLWHGLLLSVIIVSTITALVPADRILKIRMTSIDLIASLIEREAGPNDLVILNPWFLGVSFNRYYHGSAPWETFPALQDPTTHRYDLLKERMKKPETISEDIARISSTLKIGGRVWVVGQVHSIITELHITPLPPPPLYGTGWSSGPYLENWNQQLIGFLSTHALQVYAVPALSDRMINQIESPNVAVFRGWVP
jgi:hypothetical protein